ncbi:MAG TPA: acyl-CoA synthetase [Caldimonas sp.]|jgi:fatty-acyl-CoA synthase|nr:acyl-CoA synthetase [Caldimonas sp.]HEX4234790.1 acyl-CoA synthetase [Caldimonas sp.]
MTTLHLLDRRIGTAWPSLATDADVRVFETVPYRERVAAESTYEALRRAATNSADLPAIVFLPNADPDETATSLSHREFFGRVTQAANAFHALGVGPGDVVSLLLPLVPQAFSALFGAEAAGIVNPVNPLLAASQIAEILRAARTKILVALGPLPGTDIWAKVVSIRDSLPDLRAILVVGGDAGAARGAQSFDALVVAQPGDRLVSGRVIAASEPAAYFHTGGTTGMPKLVRHSHGNQVYQAWAMSLMLRNQPDHTLLFGLPLFHVGGALTQALAPLSAGGTLVVLSPGGWRNPNAVKNVWRLVERFRPEVFGGVPTVLGAALTVPADGSDTSSIRYCSGGGSAIPVPIGRAYRERFGVEVIEVYGMTETSSVHTIAYTDRPVRLGSVGHAVPYSKVRIVEVDGDGRWRRDCAPGEIGVVAMAGPGVFSGYLSETHNRGAFVEPGWVNSGDLGRLDDDGYLWITGRAKDLIIRGAHNIDPMAIEEVFFGHSAVALAAVVSEPDAYAGELPVAFVQLKPGAAIDAAELLGYVAERTPERAAVPVQLYFVAAIPLTAVGKVFKPALRWDAAERAVRRMLAAVAASGCAVDVAVGSHAEHGTLVTVTLGCDSAPARVAYEQQVRAKLDPLPLRHAIVWR